MTMISSGVPATESNVQKIGVRKNSILVETSIIGCRSLNLAVKAPIHSVIKKPLTITRARNAKMLINELKLNEYLFKAKTIISARNECKKTKNVRNATNQEIGV